MALTEYAVFWRAVKGPPTVSHVFVSTKDAEAALELAQKMVGKEGVCFRAEPEPTWEVTK